MHLSSFQLGMRILVKTYYTEGHRFYHTMDHIEAMLDGYHKHFGDISDEEYIAILYHDTIQLPWTSGNEENSVNLMYAHHTLYFPKFDKEKLAKAAQIILDTKHTGEVIAYSSQRVIDLDLMILGKSDEVYNKYVANTRKEYAMYSDEQWKAGRTSVLQKFLLQERIYQTQVMFDKYEQKARENIQRELHQLNA